jgi:hypothetical protein
MALNAPPLCLQSGTIPPERHAGLEARTEQMTVMLCATCRALHGLKQNGYGLAHREFLDSVLRRVGSTKL